MKNKNELYYIEIPHPIVVRNVGDHEILVDEYSAEYGDQAEGEITTLEDIRRDARTRFKDLFILTREQAENFSYRGEEEAEIKKQLAELLNR